MASQRETRLRQKIAKACKDRGAFIFHPHGSQYGSGAPDLVGCYHGFFFAMEVKLPENKKGMTEQQRARLATIHRAEGFSAEVRSSEEAMELLDLIDEVLA